VGTTGIMCVFRARFATRAAFKAWREDGAEGLLASALDGGVVGPNTSLVVMNLLKC